MGRVERDTQRQTQNKHESELFEYGNTHTHIWNVEEQLAQEMWQVRCNETLVKAMGRCKENEVLLVIFYIVLAVIIEKGKISKNNQLNEISWISMD